MAAGRHHRRLIRFALAAVAAVASAGDPGIAADPAMGGDAMRVTLETEGGLAHFPGLAKPVTIEAGELSDEVRAALEQLARQVVKPSATRGAKAQRPDGRIHHLTIELAGTTRRLTLTEPVDDPALRTILNAVQAAIRGKRNPG